MAMVMDLQYATPDSDRQRTPKDVYYRHKGPKYVKGLHRKIYPEKFLRTPGPAKLFFFLALDFFSYFFQEKRGIYYGRSKSIR